MTDETTPPETPPEQPPETPPETKSPFSEDGSLVKDWHKLAPDDYEGLRDSKTLPRIKKFWELAKTYEHVRKQVPLDKTSIPDDTWGDAEWSEWHRLGGRPDTAGDYLIKRPDEIPEEFWDDETAKGWEEFFFKNGASKTLVDAISARNNELTIQKINDVRQQNEIELNTLKDNLVKKWGVAYNEKDHLGYLAIEKATESYYKLGDRTEDQLVASRQEYKQRLLDKVKRDPDLMEFAANTGSLFAEHKLVESGADLVPTPGDIQQQITKIMADPRYTHKDKSVRRPLINQIMELRKQLNKEK